LILLEIKLAPLVQRLAQFLGGLTIATEAVVLLVSGGLVVFGVAPGLRELVSDKPGKWFALHQKTRFLPPFPIASGCGMISPLGAASLAAGSGVPSDEIRPDALTAARASVLRGFRRGGRRLAR
jgi:hypothetical protein